jgi:hypothetical protein
MSCVKFPQTEISNGIIRAKIYLPDFNKGYYRGTRFDWSGNISSLEYNGHNYFGKWFRKYSPEIHDAIMGPVEEFTPLDYPETKPGGSFMKIGVGILSKPDDKPYSFFRLYPVLNPGNWKSEMKSDQVQFIHELTDTVYSYQYEKIVQLIKDKPELVLIHTLRNLGTRTIETSVYDHNLFVMDKQTTGPDFVITFPFNISGEGPGIGEMAEFNVDKILFLKKLNDDESVSCDSIKGFGTSAKDYEIKIENRKTKAGVRITCDQPLMQLAFWSCSTTLCPEPYIKIKVEPGHEFRWKISYEFYTLNN